jgi:hypothetical protein
MLFFAVATVVGAALLTPKTIAKVPRLSEIGTQPCKKNRRKICPSNWLTTTTATTTTPTATTTTTPSTATATPSTTTTAPSTTSTTQTATTTAAAATAGTCAFSSQSPLTFPRNPGAVGTGLPAVDSSPEYGDFTRIDTMNYGSGRSARLTWAADPYGTGAGTVLRSEVRYGDTSRYEGERADLFVDRSAQNGKEGWYFLKYGLDFASNLPAWAVLFQLYGGSGSPPVAIDVVGGNLALVTEYPSEVKRTLVAGVPEGRWQYTVLHVVQCESANGLVETWHGDGAKPDTSAPPAYRVIGIPTDTSGADGFPEMGLYRSHSDASSTYPSVAYWAISARRASNSPPPGW